MTPEPAWVETQATVTSCKYQFARMNTLTFGIHTQSKFRITFDYYAHGMLYSDEFQSPVAIAQNEQFPLQYNPLKPNENDKSSGAGSSAPLIAIGVAGSIVLSLVWLMVLRGCS